MKIKLSAMLTTLLLSACTGGISNSGVSLGLGLGGSLGHHLGLGTSLNIPLGSLGKGTEKTSDSDNKGGLRIIEEQIVTYFDAQGQASNSAVKGGYHRQLLKKESNGNYLVQDFYESGEKRTDAMVLTKETLFTFRAHPENGAYTVYAINGNIMQQQNYRNGQLISVAQ